MWINGLKSLAFPVIAIIIIRDGTKPLILGRSHHIQIQSWILMQGKIRVIYCLLHGFGIWCLQYVWLFLLCQLIGLIFVFWVWWLP